jgi:GNAT superfamily N-acetyltransferase
MSSTLQSNNSSSEILIRLAEKQDVSTILSFIKDLAEYEKLTDEVIADEESLENFLFSTRPFAEVFIAEYGMKLVGFALFFHTFSTFMGKPGLYLEDLYVKPEMRGKGVGKTLFRKVAQMALERDCGRLEWSVLNWNEPAIGFYKKLGAQAMNEWTVYRLSGDSLSNFSG